MQNYLRFKEADYLDDVLERSYLALMVIQEYFGIKNFQTEQATKDYVLVLDVYENQSKTT